MNAPKQPTTMDVTDATFEKEVFERSRELPVVIDFWARWCGPCQVLGPMLEELADEYAGEFLLAKVDIDKSPGLAQQFRVSSIPLVVALKNGELAGHFMGAQSEEYVRTFLSRLLPSPSEKLIVEALDLEATDPAAAIARYQQVLATDPKNTVARAGLAELELNAGRLDAARTYLEQVGEGSDGWPRAANVAARLSFLEEANSLGTADECTERAAKHPDDVQARFNLGIALAAAGRFEEALEQLVSVAEADRTMGNEQVKKRMVQIFGILGQQHPATTTYRSRLASAIY